MPQDIASLLQLLTGGQAPLDPRAQFLAQAHNAGTLPGDPSSNVNTILDLLSPSASQDFLDRFGGPPALQQATGLPSPDIESIIRQQFGLEVSPVAAASNQVDLFKLLPSLMQAGSAQQNADTNARNATTAEGTASANKVNQEAELKIKQDAEARLQKTLTEGSIADKAALYETNLKQMALNGTTLLGEKVDKATQQNAFAILRGVQGTPGLGALIAQLAQAKQFSEAAQLLGIPEEHIKKGFFGDFAGITPEGAALVRSGGALNFGQAEGTTATPETKQMLDDFNANFDKLMEEAAKLR